MVDSSSLFQKRPKRVEGAGGQGEQGGQGSGVRENMGAGGVRVAGEDKAGRGICKVVEVGRNSEKGRYIYILHKKSAMWRKPEVKGTGSGRLKPPCAPPPSRHKRNYSADNAS